MAANSSSLYDIFPMLKYDRAALIFLGLSRMKGFSFRRLRELGGVDSVAATFDQMGAEDFLAKWSREVGFADPMAEVLHLGEGAVATLESRGIGMIRPGQPGYPARLTNLDEGLQPAWLFYKGNLELAEVRSVAVVGTRSPTEVGEYLTKYAVSTVREVGAAVVSGLAKGVDELAHEWALTSRVPNISILGNGLLKVYPMRNADLAARIVDSGGLLLSEYLPDAAPSAESFVWRNRLQAALSLAVIAPEWKASSGTAHTIKYAKRFGVPTINLSPLGVAAPDDHGTADVAFHVPQEHSALVSALRASFNMSIPRQPDLLGDGQ